MAAALLIEGSANGANSWSASSSFRGRVNAFADAGTWTGTISVQRRFLKSTGTYTNWLSFIEFTDGGGTETFVEHEDGVQYRIGTILGVTGGPVYVRLSQ